jgi:hypothetical protein
MMKVALRNVVSHCPQHQHPSDDGSCTTSQVRHLILMTLQSGANAMRCMISKQGLCSACYPEGRVCSWCIVGRRLASSFHSRALAQIRSPIFFGKEHVSPDVVIVRSLCFFVAVAPVGQRGIDFAHVQVLQSQAQSSMCQTAIMLAALQLSSYWGRHNRVFP